MQVNSGSTPRKMLVMISGSSPPTPPPTMSSSSVVAVYPPSSRKIGLIHQNGVDTPVMKPMANGKRMRLSSEDIEMTAETIKSQIFAYGKKPEIKLTLFPEMYSCSDCCELFYTELGLKEHHQREVFNAILSCPHCPLKKLFSNRCRLLNHLKGHGVSPTVDSLQGIILFEGLPEQKEFRDYSISIPTKHPGYTPSAPTTIIPSQLDIAKTELQKIILRGERQYKIIPLNNLPNSPTPIPLLPIPVSTVSVLQTQQTIDITRKSEFFCPSCGKDHLDKTSFLEHVKKYPINSSGIFRCNIDGVPCRSSCELNLHTRLFHDKIGPFICIECELEYSTLDALMTHDKVDCLHFQKVVIYTCGFSEDKKIGNCTTSEISHVGTACKRKYTKFIHLLKHFEEHSRELHKCNNCQHAFVTDDVLRKHFISNHDVNEATAKKQEFRIFVQCFICQEIFATRAYYDAHLKSNLSKHCETIITFRCSKCGNNYDQGKLLTKHKCIPKNELKTENLYNLENGISNSVLRRSSIESLDRNRPTSSSPQLPQVKQQPTTIIPKCLYCNHFFTSIRSLKRHEKICDFKVTVPKKPEFCKLCSKTLQGTKSFLSHSITHLNAGMKICLFCNNQLLEENENIDSHLLGHVQALKKFPHLCEFCDQVLQTKNQAHAHFLSHHEKTLNRFKCAICGDHFGSVPDLTNHKNTVHSIIPTVKVSQLNGLRQVKSPRPGFSYSYICKYCTNKKFQTRTGLRKHLRNHHRDIDFSPIEWNEMRRIKRNDPTTSNHQTKQKIKKERRDTYGMNQPQFTASGTHLLNTGKDSISLNDIPIGNARSIEGTFECLKCSMIDGVSFSNESSFYDHIRLVHVWQVGEDDINQKDNTECRDQSFWCPECSLEFVAKPSFRMHLQFAHSYIKNITEYLDDIGYGKKEKPVNENQCSVCRVKCEDSSEYERHIRSHGMAFLRQRLKRSST